MIKFIYLILLLCLTASHTAYSQGEKYIKAMENAIAKLNTYKQQEELQQTANDFERIAFAESSKWLPYYYTAYAQIFLGYFEEKKKKKDSYYDKSLNFISKADSLSPDNSEIYTLKGYALQMKMLVNPMVRGKKYGPISGKTLQKAMELDDNNPRPYYLLGQNLFYTPPQFGGGKDKACPLLEKSIERYDKFIPKNSIMPTWGEERARGLFGKCNETETENKNK